jgi:thiamine-phosphate pyrophosphorylase
VSLPAKSERPLLCYVTDRRSLPLSTSADANLLLLDNVERTAAAGVDWIQLREKDYSGKEWMDLVREALRRVSSTGSATRILVNDRMDVALACGAGGVHLSESGIPVAEACHLRSDFFSKRGEKEDFLIGASCHTIGSALGAERAGADYIYFSPIFKTPSKATFGPPQGLERLSQICRAVQIPVLAIGGIGAQNATSCMQAGAAGIGAIRLFQESAGLPEIIRSLHSPTSLPSA